MIKEIKQNRIEVELYKLLSSSKYTHKGKSLVLLYDTHWVIDVDYVVDTIFVFKRNLINMIGYEVSDNTIRMCLDKALNLDYKIKIV